MIRSEYAANLYLQQRAPVQRKRPAPRKLSALARILRALGL